MALRIPTGHPDRAIPVWMLYPLFFVAVFLSHWTLLRLPYFWDEGGYYIPAAWDFFRTGTLIPQSTVTNAHPPLPSILLAAWWHLSGYVVIGTRTLVCLVTAAALLAIYRLARSLAGGIVATVTVLLTAAYPIWFAQSTLAHADIFAAAFTLWALAVYLEPAPTTNPKTIDVDITNPGAPRPALEDVGRTTTPPTLRNQLLTATLFSLAALSKETAIVTPVALAAWELYQLLRTKSKPIHRTWLITLLIPILPLLAWYAYHYHRTGYVFGNPEFLRYNATANLAPYRILLSLWHRLLHLTTHMNMFVPILCTCAAILTPVPVANKSRTIPRSAIIAIAVVLVANWLAFSVLGGALLTRYLLPLYPLILLLCVATWYRHVKQWWALALLSLAAFTAAIWINPPYAFAPEDNLTYRDMIVLHQQAVHIIERQFPQATVLTAWPATSELARPEIGYTHHPIKVFAIQNFSMEQIQKAAAEPGEYDTALLFSTKWEPPAGQVDLGKRNQSDDTRYFDFHHDLTPEEAAAVLHGEVFWQGHRKGEWAAILRFPRIVDAQLTHP